MMDRQDEESPSPGALGDDRQESWVDGAEVVVLDAARDGHAIEAALLGGGLTKHVAELGAPVLRTPCHLKVGGEGRGSEGGDGGGQSRRVASSCAFHTAVPSSQAQGRATVNTDAFFKTGAVGGRNVPLERRNDNEI